MRPHPTDRVAVEKRFAGVFTHLGFITAYARRRGGQDPEAIAAEVMAIAWRRLADIPLDDARPWLILTARHLLLAEHRRRGTPEVAREGAEDEALNEPEPEPAAGTVELDPELSTALMSLSETDREALLLVAWEDLTPTLAAASLGVSAAAFRIRLYRARRRLIARLGVRLDTVAASHPRSSLEES